MPSVRLNHWAISDGHPLNPNIRKAEVGHRILTENRNSYQPQYSCGGEQTPVSYDGLLLTLSDKVNSEKSRAR